MKGIGREPLGCSQETSLMLGRLGKMPISVEVAQLINALPANAWKMFDDLPLTIAENILRNGAVEIVATFEKRKCPPSGCWMRGRANSKRRMQ